MQGLRSFASRFAFRLALLPALGGLLCYGVFAAEDVRTWTDVTGKHTMKGAFVKLEDGKVYLKQESGAELVVPVEKLSAADAKIAKDLAAANPFQEAPAEGNPFQPAEGMPAAGKALKPPGPKPEYPRLPPGTAPAVRSAAIKNYTDALFAYNAAKREYDAQVKAAGGDPNADKSGKTGKSKDDAEPLPPGTAADVPDLFEPDFSTAKKIDFAAAPLDWRVTLGPIKPLKKLDKPKPLDLVVPGPREYYDKPAGEAYAEDAQRLVRAYTYDPFNKTKLTKLLINDCVSGKALGIAMATGSFSLVAVNADATRAVMWSAEDREQAVFELWELTKTGIERKKRWRGATKARFFAPEMKDGLLLDDKRLLVQAGGELRLWDLETMSIVFGVPDVQRYRLFPDRRHVLIQANEKLVVLDLEKHETVASHPMDTQRGWHNGAFAISDEGRMVAYVAGGYGDRSLSVLNVVDGRKLPPIRLYADVTEIHWLDTSRLLVCGSDTILVDLMKKLPVWEYEFPGAFKRFGGVNWVESPNGDGKHVRAPAVVPHALAEQKIASFTAPPIEYYLQPGDAVSLDLSGIGDSTKMQEAETAIKARLARNGMRVDPSAPTKLIAKIETGKTEEIVYRNSFTCAEEKHSFTPQISSLRYMLGDLRIWNTSSSGSAPWSFYPKNEGDTISAEIQRQQQPRYELFTNPPLPKQIEIVPKAPYAGKSWVVADGGIRETPPDGRLDDRIPKGRPQPARVVPPVRPR
ncbi:MAG: SHD1 domain-containing protein [Pirellulales bacterium]